MKTSQYFKYNFASHFLTNEIFPMTTFEFTCFIQFFTLLVEQREKPFDPFYTMFKVFGEAHFVCVC